MFRYPRSPTFLGLGLLAAVLAIGLMASGGVRTAHAQMLPSFDCDQDLCIGLDPGWAENDAGTEHTVTATVTDAQGAVPDEEVSFEVTAGPNSGAMPNPTPTTDVYGQATFTYTGDGGAGYDTIRACVEVDGVDQSINLEELCVEVGKQWFEHRLTLTPVEATNLVGTEHTVTATVTKIEDGAPAVGVRVDIHVWQGPNVPELFFPCDGVEEACLWGGVTNVDGEVKLTYTSDGEEGTDSIYASACISVDFECIEWPWAEATKEWVGPTTITLTPKTDLNEVGTKHTVTATVVDSDGRVEDAKVTFTVTEGPNKADTGTDTTDANGEATFTYTGDGGADKDTIQACVPDPVAEKDVCDTATKEWKAVVLAATATPTPTPAALGVTELPTAGGEPTDSGSSGLGWLAAIAGAIAVTAAGGFWFARRARRVR